MIVSSVCNYTFTQNSTYTKWPTYHRYDEIKFTCKFKNQKCWDRNDFSHFFTAERDPANFAIRGVLIPILAIAGTIANILTIRVFNTPKMKSPIHTILIGRYSYISNSKRESNMYKKYIYKIGLAVCDTLVLVGVLTTRGFPMFGIYFINQVGSVLSPVTMPLVLMGITSSTLMTVFLSLERYFAVCRKETITYKKVYIYMAVIGIYSFLRFLPTFWLRRITTKDGGITSEMNEDLNCNKDFHQYVLYIPNLILRFILPTIVLIVTSILTLKEVKFLQKISIFDRNSKI